MSKVFYLNQNSSCEVSGTTNIPLFVSTNEKQLNYISKRLNTVSSDEYTVVSAFDYLPKQCKNISFITYEDNDWDWCYFEILDQFFDLEKSQNIIEDSVAKHSRQKHKENGWGTVRVTNMPVMHQITRKEIHEVLYSANSCYMELEAENKSKQNGSYWLKQA